MGRNSSDVKEKKDRKKRHRSKERDSRSHRKKLKKDRGHASHSEGEEQWVEKEVQAPASAAPVEHPPPTLARDDWMTTPGDGFDFTGSKGPAPERKRDRDIKREEEEKRRTAIRAERELNPYFKEGGEGLPPSEATEEDGAKTRRYEFGDGGSNWRMMKFRRVLESAEDEGRETEEVALERYGSLEDFAEAQAERAFLDERRNESRKDEFGRNIAYRPTVRKTLSFQKPGAERGAERERNLGRDRDERSSKSATVDISESASRPSTPLIKVGHAPPATLSSKSSGELTPILSKNALNALNSKVLKAKLMGLPDAAELEKQYDFERKRAENTNLSDGPVLLSGIDIRGRLLDVGSSQATNQAPTKRQKIEQDTHDKDGNRVRYSAEDDKHGLSDLIMQEKMAGVHDFDTHMAERIARDSTYVNNLDYVDDNVDRLSKRKVQSEDQKRKFAVEDYQKHEKAISSCAFCFHNGLKPRVPLVALGVKAYLTLPEVIDMVPGHCLIVPVEHVLTTLECDDDTWDEIRVTSLYIHATNVA
ncbi:unnamed protein product [Sphagnum tenellum]